MKQFDEEFSRKAKEAFDSFNADHLAEEGWNSYIKKYEKSPARRFIIPLWARVASVAALLAVAILLTNRISQREAGDTGIQLAQENRGEQTDPEIIKEDTAAARPVEADTFPVVESAAGKTPVIADSGQDIEMTTSKTGQTPSAGSVKPDYKTVKPAKSVLAELADGEKPGQNKAGEAGESHLNEAGKASGSILTEPAAAEAMLLAAAETDAVMAGGMNFPDNPIKIRLADDAEAGLRLKPKAADKDFIDVPREKMTTTIMTGLSGMMASVDNATSAAQGVSFGLYVDRQLTRRISIRPGLAMARHNYGIESTSVGGIAMDYSAPELNGLSGTTTSYEASIDVLSLEVPVNFVFSLWKRSGSNFFISTGASTVIYLDQHLTGNVNNTYTRSTVDAYSGQVSFESMTTFVKIESDKEPLDRVDVLGLANFSAGYSFPFIKTRHLLFEPFVQLPLKDLTSLDLRIRYGGLSMKIQF